MLLIIEIIKDFESISYILEHMILKLELLFFTLYWDYSLYTTATTVLSYVNMVCGSLRHTIPKSVVYCQVREAKRSLLDHFFTELGKKEVSFVIFLEEYRHVWWE